MVSIEKSLNKDFKTGKISDLKFGREIKVEKVDGFWKEIE